MTLETKRAFIRGPLAFRGPGPRPALGDPGCGVRTAVILQKERLPNGPPRDTDGFSNAIYVRLLSDETACLETFHIPGIPPIPPCLELPHCQADVS